MPAGLLLGCGKMGGAILSGWLAQIEQGSFPLDELHVVDPEADIPDHGVITPYKRVEDLPEALSPICSVLAVKPQIVEKAAAPLGRFPDSLFLSIIAGKRIEFFAQLFGPAARIIRAMPNTPAAIARGITVMVVNARARADDRVLCDELLGVVGDVEWVEDEGLMDAVTALSGSGPAYVFLLLEAMRAAGVSVGLKAGLAERLALATVRGSAELMACSGEDPADLRRNVTSPGGTTEAALRVLMADDGGMIGLLRKAVQEARQRSRDLA